MLGQVLSFPSRQWLSALPPGVPSHPPAPGPVRSPTFDILLFFVGLSTPVSENDLPKWGFKMKPMCTSPALWAPAARGT